MTRPLFSQVGLICWPELGIHHEIIPKGDHMAVVKAISPQYVDYCQLLQFEEGWKIVNVLWELREGEVEAEA